MKFTLKDYQDDAVKDVLSNLRKARKRWHEDGDKHAFSLTATTGAGKTVMAAAVFEALFFGNDDYDFEPDLGAVVIWFSDDPSLNEQSKYRLMEASDKLNISSLVTVDNRFGREKFEPGKIYFLNTQKLSKKSLLVRGHDPDELELELGTGRPIMPDGRSHTIWDTIQNTIEDPDLTLYLILDEAHRGMGNQAAGHSTIVQQLINGTRGAPSIPIVWGISATVERFNEAMRGMQGRDTLQSVVVSAKLVQDSGLLKDTINLDIPFDDETTDFSTILLRRGTRKLREISEAWATYAAQQDGVTRVFPLMVLQVPNSPDPDEIGRWLHTIFEAWPELPTDCVYNVFGEHREESFGPYSAPYISPERVQESEWVRLLVAKDAISTGWDCPRAEVMVSFRAASDRTHITQLLGRMIRTPLARRIPGNERLNSVDCLLPYFNKKNVTDVVTSLMTGEGAGESYEGRRVLINPVEISANPEIAEEVWDKFLSLPSQTLPKRQPRPIKRLTTLAHELAADGLLKNAGKLAHAELHKIIDGDRVRFSEEIKSARNSVLTVEGRTAQTNVENLEMTFNDFVEHADHVVIEDSYRQAARLISPDLARTYSEHLANKADEDDIEEALVEAHTEIAAIGLVPKIHEHLAAEADSLSNEWLSKFRVDFKNLNDERQDVYRQLSEMSSHPLDVDLARPKRWLVATVIQDPDGRKTEIPKYEKHLLCNEEGLFPAQLNTWETKVLLQELERPEVISWYRNPSRPTQDSLGMTYEEFGQAKIVRPDFLIFSKHPGGGISVDLIDPHGIHLADANEKLKGLASYAEKHHAHFRRIDAIAEIDGVLKVLDMTEKTVRDAIIDSDQPTSLYHQLAKNY